MDQQAIEQYKREMMKLYGKSTSSAEEANETHSPSVKEEKAVIEEANETNAPENTEQVNNNQTYKEQHPVSEEIEDVDENAPDDTAYSANERYPEPDLSELNLDNGQSGTQEKTTSEYDSEINMGTSTGYIIVNTRAGEESSPVSDASVLITAIIDGKREIIASGKTNESGTSERFSVPAPDLVHSQSPDSLRRPYSLFDISVTAKGFFNARSVDVPVFSGITSVQNFSMIPVPIMMKSGDETVTYINQEPDFPDVN
ncbi:MAG: carboxypeptidase regulatory-like domain-containing protein [Ruminococcus sp.]|nr:carboxypeptidase regulatory-like domain-containing protein [Ruminococcus sp.]